MPQQNDDLGLLNDHEKAAAAALKASKALLKQMKKGGFPPLAVQHALAAEETFASAELLATEIGKEDPRMCELAAECAVGAEQALLAAQSLSAEVEINSGEQENL